MLYYLLSGLTRKVATKDIILNLLLDSNIRVISDEGLGYKVVLRIVAVVEKNSVTPH